MRDFHHPAKILMVTPSRVGSIWLLSLLDSHPDIFALKSEPLSPGSHWVSLHQLEVDVRRNVFVTLWKNPGAYVNVLKMSYRQNTKHEDILHLADGIIHLTRQNLLRVAVSSEFNTEMIEKNQESLHSFMDPELIPRQVNVRRVITTIGSLNQSIRLKNEYLKGLDKPVYNIEYERLVTHTNQVTTELLNWLGLEPRDLISRLKPTNHFPLSKSVANWESLKIELEKSWPRYLMMEQEEWNNQSK